MSLSAKILGLVVISALLVFSCKEKEQIGLQTRPGENQIGVHFTDTFTVNTYVQLKNDSIRTSQQNYIHVGAYEDPIFGHVSSQGFVQLFQEIENKNVSGYTSVDSVVLNLYYTNYYGDTLQNQTLKVYELSDEIYKDTIYYSTDPSPAKDITALDQDIAFQARPSTKVQKIKLNNEFGEDLFDNIIMGGISNANFLTSFKGIAIEPKNPNEGAILKVDLTGNQSWVTVYYKDASSVNQSVKLVMRSADGAEFSRITSDRSFSPYTEVSSLVTSGDETNGNGKLFLESGIGIRTRVEIPYFTELKKKGNISINRAELVLEVDETDTEKSKYPPILLLDAIKLNEDNTIEQYLDASGNYQTSLVQIDGSSVTGQSNALKVAYDNTNSAYIFPMSSYFHAILHDALEFNGLIIAADPLVADSDVIVNSTRVNRVLAGSGSKKVKLKVYFTLID